MTSLFLLFYLLAPGDGSARQAPASFCQEVVGRAISLNEAYKDAVSAGGKRAFEVEAGKYFNTVLKQEISGCVDYASAHADTSLSKRIFELAYSYADSDDEVVPRELARLYSSNPERMNSILLDFESSRRRELIEILKRGLSSLSDGKVIDKNQLQKLEQRIRELDSR